MKRITGSWLAIIAAGVLVAAATPAWADNPLGLYVGAGIGVSNVGNNYSSNYCNCYPYGYYGGYNNNNNVAWKVMLGMRPVPVIGAEVEYLDFGSSNGNDGYYNSYYDYGANTHPKATMLFAVGYLPIPVPNLDVFGKLGAAHLQTDISFNTCTGAYNPAGGPGSCPTSSAYAIDQSNTKFAYGAGVQWRYQEFAFRAEYEGVSSEYGNPEAISVSVTWTF